MKLHTKKNGSLYKNLKLQTKFTITHLVIATIPMIVLAIFFYTKLYDMIIADTIRTEQNSSTQTAPLIEDAVSRILRLHDQITGEEFYHQIVSSARTETLSGLADGDSAAVSYTHLDVYKRQVRAILYVALMPTASTTTSGPIPSVSFRILSMISGVSALRQMSAPRDFAISSL